MDAATMLDATICTHCNTVVLRYGQNWRHWDGFYRCETMPLEFADPIPTPEAQEDKATEAYEQGYSEGWKALADDVAAVIER